MSNLYKRSFRGYLVDHHSPAPPIITFDRLSVAEHELFYKQANIDNLILYMKDHWGYSYYDTEIGTRHPALNRDIVAELVPILRKFGIEFTAYYSFEYEVNALFEHPEWAIRDENGEARRLKGRFAKWGLACYETGYRQYVLGQLTEIVTKFKPDSLFLDIFGKTLCYCDACREKFHNQYGYDLPKDPKAVRNEIATLNFGKNGHDVNRFLEDSAAEMLRDVLATVKGIDPSIAVTINFAALYPKRIRDMLDYQFTEPWAGNWLSAAYARDTARDQYPLLGPGDVSQIYNYKDDDVYSLAAAQIAAGGCRVFMYSESMHRDGSLEHTEPQKIGKAYAEVKKYEQYLQNREILADIAIIQSDRSVMAKSGDDVVINAIGRCKKADAHREAVCGAMQVCDRLGYAWRILPEQEATVDELCKHQCVILASVYSISDELKASLFAFAARGGKIIADGESGLYSEHGDMLADFSLTNLLGVSYVERITRFESSPWGGYIRPVKDPIWKHTPETTPPIASTQINVKAETAEVKGELLPLVVPLTETSWVNWGCPPPLNIDNASPAVTCCDGHYYIAYEYFRMKYASAYLNTSLLEGILEQVIARPSIRLVTDARDALSIMSYRRGNGYIVHELSRLAEKLQGTAPEISGGRLLIQLKGITKATLRYPEDMPLPIGEGGVILLPPLSVHQIIELE